MATIGRNSGITYFGNNSAARNVFIGARGPQGAKGDTGVGVASADINTNGELVLGLTNNATLNAGSVVPSAEVWTKDDVIPTSIGGITAGTVGQTLDGLTPMQILEKLLYPYQTLSVSSFSVGLPISTTVEVGTTCAAGTYASSWAFNNASNLTANSISISQGSTTLASGLNISPFSITHSQYQYTTPTQLPFTITAGQKEGANVTSTVNYSWKYKTYCFKSSLTSLGNGFNPTTDATVSGLSSAFTSGLFSFANTNFSTSSTDEQYLYILLPYLNFTNSYNSFTLGGFPWDKQSLSSAINITINGITASYKYYRSTNKTQSTPTIIASI